jgi:hypothetical protein
MAIDEANVVIRDGWIAERRDVVASDTMAFRGADSRQWDCDPGYRRPADMDRTSIA